MDGTPFNKPRGRPAFKHGLKKLPKKYRNVHLSYKMKQAVIDSFDECGMATTLARHFPLVHGSKLDSTRKKVFGVLLKLTTPSPTTPTSERRAPRLIGFKKNYAIPHMPPIATKPIHAALAVAMKSSRR
ncbi:hypothetical protein H310_06911 [Aphanomyces invadans]|uniref:Uncharacterized protein n=1 Tax=Aphanomyces invadans TaxID=157072 RepID=A0A024U6X9_9STRA|nr:hypothetical protein H310_06911 [Aphanomyces invadans]ETW01353.1 hypothetical protein H310_06911 [Aphanomyces invadans]|eukprot:XP_008870351.1 hypothetical protein H310_06911 [Aphanomyces invadans]